MSISLDLLLPGIVLAIFAFFMMRKSRENRATNQLMEAEQQNSESHLRYVGKLEQTETSQAISTALESLEQERQTLHKKIVRNVKLGFTVLASCVLALLFFAEIDVQVSIPLIMLGGALVFFYNFRQSAKLRNRAKQQLMEKLCGDLGFKHSLDVDKSKLSTFENLGLLPRYDYSRPSDFIQGKTLGGHPFELVDVELKRSGKKDSPDTTAFSGLLIHVASHSSVDEQVLVKKRQGIKALNPFADEHRVYLESDEFSAVYEVYASDQVAARRLLAPSIMENCVELDRKTVGTPQIAFFGGEVYVAIDRGKTSFDMPGLNEPWTGKVFERSLSELTFAIEVAGVFDHELQTT